MPLSINATNSQGTIANTLHLRIIAASAMLTFFSTPSILTATIMFPESLIANTYLPKILAASVRPIICQTSQP